MFKLITLQGYEVRRWVLYQATRTTHLMLNEFKQALFLCLAVEATECSFEGYVNWCIQLRSATRNLTVALNSVHL